MIKVLKHTIYSQVYVESKQQKQPVSLSNLFT